SVISPGISGLMHSHLQLPALGSSRLAPALALLLLCTPQTGKATAAIVASSKSVVERVAPSPTSEIWRRVVSNNGGRGMPFTYKLSKRLAQMHASDSSHSVADGLLPASPVVQPLVALSPPQLNHVVSPSGRTAGGFVMTFKHKLSRRLALMRNVSVAGLVVLAAC